jgi:hypothetical protein
VAARATVLSGVAVVVTDRDERHDGVRIEAVPELIALAPVRRT